VAAAQALERKWIGIDVTHLAITLIKNRMWDAFGKGLPFEVVGEPVSLPDARELAARDPYQFQWWSLGLVGARPAEQKKGADKGIDGRLYFHDDVQGARTKQVIFSVKAGHSNVSQLRDLQGVLVRENAEIGVLILMEEPSKPMRTEAAASGFYKSIGWNTAHPQLQILTIRELLEGTRVDMPPLHQVSMTFKKATHAKAEGPIPLALPLDSEEPA